MVGGAHHHLHIFSNPDCARHIGLYASQNIYGAFQRRKFAFVDAQYFDERVIIEDIIAVAGIRNPEEMNGVIR